MHQTAVVWLDAAVDCQLCLHTICQEKMWSQPSSHIPRRRADVNETVEGRLFDMKLYLTARATRQHFVLE